jgi:hypothetical protein
MTILEKTYRETSILAKFNKLKLVIVYATLGYIIGNVYPTFTIIPFETSYLPEVRGFALSEEDSLPVLPLVDEGME